MMNRQSLVRHLDASRRALAALALLLLFAAHALAQKDAPAMVAGRVREGERGVAGVTVVVMSADPSQRFKTVARARTDAEGRYRITSVPPGRYTVLPIAPAYFLQDYLSNFPPGKFLTLSAGDSVDNTDFRVVRGGVITGRVLDSDGNPIINEPVRLSPVDPDPGRSQVVLTDQRDISTDDRGVYRLYGLQPGRYRVSVGSDGRTFRASSEKYYSKTFYPSAADESQAKIVEVAAGDEIKDIDITLGAPEKTYRVFGRFVLADTNQPVQVAGFGFGMVDPGTGRITGSFGGGSSNARGEFQASGLVPGRYKVFANPGPIDNVDWYSDATEFEITDSDVSGLVVKLRRGSSISGVVAIEGVSDRAAAASMLARVRVYGFSDQNDRNAGVGGYVRPVTLSPDGSFTLTGVRPGKLRLNANSEVKGLAFSRMELAGVVQRDGLQVAEGAQVTGVRLVLVYGTAVLRGQLNFPDSNGEGSTLQGMRMIVAARRVSGTGDQSTKGTEADARGHFQFEGLAAGEYEVTARAFIPNVRGSTLMSEPQRVSVAEGGDVTISLTLAPPPAIVPQGGRP